MNANVSIIFQLGLYAHPIFSVSGGYPQVVANNVDENSRRENRRISRLPKFTAAEIEYVKGSADFFGLNYYTSAYATPGTNFLMPNPSLARDQNIIESKDPSWPMAKSRWLQSVPEGLRALLK